MSYHPLELLGCSLLFRLERTLVTCTGHSRRSQPVCRSTSTDRPKILVAPVYLKALTVDSLSVSDNTINYRYDDDDYYYMYIYIDISHLQQLTCVYSLRPRMKPRQVCKPSQWQTLYFLQHVGGQCHVPEAQLTQFSSKRPLVDVKCN